MNGIMPQEDIYLWWTEKFSMGYFEEVIQNYVVEKLLGNNIPFSWHHALIVLLKESEIVQNFSHLGFPRPNMDILNMEDWKNPARNTD